MESTQTLNPSGLRRDGLNIASGGSEVEPLPPSFFDHLAPLQTDDLLVQAPLCLRQIFEPILLFHNALTTTQGELVTVIAHAGVEIDEEGFLRALKPGDL
ncbi:hypothetical protein OUZ56_025506 [Daphnia magna]|uniref:Uncharacterized protein n=1 Tax=Daphnia magna TaxID=35525 RepID=A0ABQ9ZK32_9CRUS|nr:hypothetical protein OUZ56_025506 [Daphnia magna]